MATRKSRSGKRRAIPKNLEAKLLVESRNTCNICWKSKEVQIHHIIPVELGGDNSEDNLIVACLNCHSVAHTKKDMARNLGPQTLRLYKETWGDLVRRYPLAGRQIEESDNDISLIRDTLKQGYRRALYFPFNLEMPVDMFDSLDDFRKFVQASGYKLVKNDAAREHIRQIYKNLVEVSFLRPCRDRRPHSLLRVLGREERSLLELRRKAICFHLNQLATLVGYDEPIVAHDEFRRMGFDIPHSGYTRRRCFGSFCEKSKDCLACECRGECLEASL